VATSPASPSEQRVPWAFWFACGLSAVAGLVPQVFGGGSNRMGGVLIPFALAAIFLGACALLFTQGRPIATLLYFLASLAIVYGMLAVLTLPLRLAVIGTCPPAPAACTSGLERPMTSGESTALGLTVGLGIVAILTGFFALVTLYRRLAPPPAPMTTPPVRRIAPVTARTSSDSVAAETAAPPLAKPVEAEPEPAPETPELAAPVEALELAAPVEPLELPEVGTADHPDEAPVAAPQRKPRRKPAAKPSEPTTAPHDEEPA
jgi:hypothetical protein